jgi:sialate O-acetylesterase
MFSPHPHGTPYHALRLLGVLVLTLPLLVLPTTARQKVREKIRVACVGNSVTYGYKLADREHTAYPVQLQGMLGDAYEVRNFGHSGATLAYNGYNPYVLLPEFRQAIDYKADLVVIHLGLNDTDPRVWPHHSDEFVGDYRALIDSFRVANPSAKIWICLMTPIFHDHPRFDSGTRDWHALIQQRIRQVAAAAGTGLIDLYTPLHTHPDLFPDALHPNAEGAGILAKTVYGALTGDHGGLSVPITYSSSMVIQRDRPITFHGTANAGERVSVTFMGQKQQATADSNGQWHTTFPQHGAGGPYTLDIAAGRERRHYDDIWLGEVWLCSGQSNMELTVPATLTAEADLAAADTCRRLHLFNMRAIAPTYATEWPAGVLDSVNHLLYTTRGPWLRSSRGVVENFSSIAYNFGRRLADSLGCHVGIITNAIGGSATEDWIDRTTLENDFLPILRDWRHNDYIMRWCRERAALNIHGAADESQRHPYEPAYLFESAVLPLERYALRGVLWYQGESNADNAEVHERLFPLLEAGWRHYWGDATLPFYTVQLSSIATRPSWPRFRDGQRLLAQHDAATYMTVTSDLGDSLDVHPRHKAEVADRLLRAVLHHTYGHSAVVPSGPLFRAMTTEGKALRLTFDYGEGLHAATGDSIVGFEVAGSDGVYHRATATVGDHATSLLVSADGVAAPVAVRYGWQAYTPANLVNAAGLPASTFRNEDAYDALYGE